jgi:peptide-methionine (S)-S-oxide reductase
LIFYHGEEQKRLAEETREREEGERGDRIYTEIVPFSEFYLAEAYHQKYRLRQVPDLMDVFRKLYPDWEDFLDSTLAARANGYVGGYGDLETVEAIVDGQGMAPETRQKLLDVLSRFSR